jgi:hypothetical protein
LQKGGFFHLFEKKRGNSWATKPPVSGSAHCQYKALSGRSRIKIKISAEKVYTQLAVLH